jgi:parvulin-like peptidyl-prolyl isomerase
LSFTLTFAQDKIIAIVNSDIITQKDLNDFLNFTKIQLSREFSGKTLEEKVQSMKLDLLDRLIEDRLILQEAKKILEEAKKKKDMLTVLRIKVDQNRVKARVDEIEKQYNSDSEFQNNLAKHGLVQADLESKITEQMLMFNIIDFKIRDNIIVSPEEVTDFYHKNLKEFILSEEREVEAVTLENLDLAKSFSYNLKRGEDLVDLAARYPLSINKMNTRKGEGLREEVEDAIFKLNIGEVSDPIEIDEKYYVFRLNNIIPSEQLSLSEAQERIHSYLFEKKFQEEMVKWLDELRHKSFIKVTGAGDV